MALNIIPSDATSVFAVLTSAQSLALVRPNNPPPGLAGLLFDIDGDDMLRLRSQISQHYIEDNTSIQDQVALEPERIVLRRYMGELIYSNPQNEQISETPDPLPSNPGMMPTLSPMAAQMQYEDATEDASQNSALTNPDTLWDLYFGFAGQAPNQTRQSIVANYIYQLWKGRQLVTVETPWGIMTNMAIESADMEQPEETASRSDFNITFQKIRVATQSTVAIGQIAGRAALQRNVTTQNGTAGTQQVTPAQQSSYLQQITGEP